MVGPALLFATLLSGMSSVAHAEDPIHGFEYATTALDEMRGSADDAHAVHRKRLRRTWGPSPECLLTHARDIDARIAVVERERGALAELVTSGHTGRLAEQRVSQHIRAIAVARAHVRETVDKADECPLVRSTRQRRRDRKPEELASR